MCLIWWLSLKRGFGGCGQGFDGCDGLSRLDGFDGLGGFDGQPRLSLKGFSVSFALLLKVLYLLINYSLSYTWLKDEPQISRKERFFIPRYLQYALFGDCVYVYIYLYVYIYIYIYIIYYIYVYIYIIIYKQNYLTRYSGILQGFLQIRYPSLCF